MFKDKLKGFVCGILVCILIFSGVVLADSFRSFIAQEEDFPIMVDGNQINLDMPVVTIDDRTYLPLRALSETLGITVGWNGSKKQVEIFKDTVPSDNDTQDNKLVVATNAEFPPFEYIVSNGNGLVGKYDGIDIVIAKRIADSLGRELEITNIRFENILPCLASGKADIGIAAIRVTPDRQESVDFSVPYYDTAQSLLINTDTGDINSIETLRGKSVGVILGYDGDIRLGDAEGINIKRYRKGSDIVYDILHGNLDAGIMDTILANEYVYRNEGLRIVDNNIFGEYEEFCIAVRKGNAEMLSRVNEALYEIKKAGEIGNAAIEVDLRMK